MVELGHHITDNELPVPGEFDPLKFLETEVDNSSTLSNTNIPQKRNLFRVMFIKEITTSGKPLRISGLDSTTQWMFRKYLYANYRHFMKLSGTDAEYLKPVDNYNIFNDIVDWLDNNTEQYFINYD